MQCLLAKFETTYRHPRPRQLPDKLKHERWRASQAQFLRNQSLQKTSKDARLDSTRGSNRWPFREPVRVGDAARDDPVVIVDASEVEVLLECNVGLLLRAPRARRALDVARDADPL